MTGPRRIPDGDNSFRGPAALGPGILACWVRLGVLQSVSDDLLEFARAPHTVQPPAVHEKRRRRIDTGHVSHAHIPQNVLERRLLFHTSLKGFKVYSGNRLGKHQNPRLGIVLVDRLLVSKYLVVERPELAVTLQGRASRLFRGDKRPGMAGKGKSAVNDLDPVRLSRQNLLIENIHELPTVGTLEVGKNHHGYWCAARAQRWQVSFRQQPHQDPAGAALLCILRVRFWKRCVLQCEERRRIRTQPRSPPWFAATEVWGRLNGKIRCEQT